MDQALDITALDEVAQARAALAARRHALEQQRLVEWQRRVARRQRQDSYPPNAPFETLTSAQQAERLDVAAELLRQFEHWHRGGDLPERQAEFLSNLEVEMRLSRLRRGISPAEWECIWNIRDAVLPAGC